MNRRLDRRARQAWDDLDEAGKREAVCRLIDDGVSEYGAAVAAGVSVEWIRSVIAERRRRGS